MGNPVNVQNGEAIQVTGARKGFYKPRKTMEIKFQTELYNVWGPEAIRKGQRLSLTDPKGLRGVC